VLFVGVFLAVLDQFLDIDFYRDQVSFFGEGWGLVGLKAYYGTRET
jgi:hypothetical protein